MMPRLLLIVAALLSAGIARAEAPATFVPVRAVLRTAPAVEANTVRLPPGGGTLGLFVGGSEGDIAEFRIDLNVAQDSDGDGTADNDADNAWHSSFRSGGTFPVNVRSAENETERGIALRVIGFGGEVSDARITVLFDPDFKVEPEVLEVEMEERVGEVGEVEEVEGEKEPSAPIIVADREILQMGEQFTLRVENAPDGISIYGWDLQGDNTFDAQTSVSSILLEPDAPGMLPVRVTFLDTEGVVMGSVTKAFMVGAAEEGGEEGEPKRGGIRIDALVRGLQVTFRPVSGQPLDLSGLEPTWEFGDGSTSYLLEPTHAYAVPGTYTVTLSLLDARSKQEVAAESAVVSVSGEGVFSVEERDGGPIASLLKPFLFVFRIALFVFLLFSLAGGGVFLFLFLAARAENVPIREVVSRYREKLRGDVPTVEIPSRPADDRIGQASPAASADHAERQAGSARIPMSLTEESEESVAAGPSVAARPRLDGRPDGMENAAEAAMQDVPTVTRDEPLPVDIGEAEPEPWHELESPPSWLAGAPEQSSAVPRTDAEASGAVVPGTAGTQARAETQPAPQLQPARSPKPLTLSRKGEGQRGEPEPEPQPAPQSSPPAPEPEIPPSPPAGRQDESPSVAARPRLDGAESPESTGGTPAWLSEGLKAAGAEGPWQAGEEEEPIAFVEGEIASEGRGEEEGDAASRQS